jgi:SNF2 family DNA or RNA helicase
VKYRWKTKPYRHQVAAVKQALRALYKRGSFALLMAPRTGKTKTAIDIASIMHQKGDVNRIVVVCPLSVIDVWVNEIRAHCPFRLRITIWDKDGRKELNLPGWGEDVMDWVILNYDAFSAPGAIIGRSTITVEVDGVMVEKPGPVKRSRSRGGRFTLMKDIKRWQPHMMILDESHRIKTPSARKTTAIWSVAWKDDEPLIPFRMILTGTVLTKKKRVFDIYSQWKFLNRKSKLLWIKDIEGKRHITLKEFKEKYAVWTERNGYPQWLRNRVGPIEGLRILLHKEAFAITREECYDLPPKYPDVLHFIPLVKSAPYYDQMAEEMVAMLESGEFTWAKIPLVQRLRLQQLTSGIAKTEPTDTYPEGRLVRVGSEKIEFLQDLMEDFKENEEKVVIGARFHGDIQAIQDMCTRMKVPCFELSGRVGRAERTSNIAEFTKMEGCAVFIAQPAAGSLGIDLSVASTLIWYSLVDSWVDYEQFTDRVALSPIAVRVIYLLAEGTIDLLKYESLQEDGDVARKVTESPRRLLRNFRNEPVAR